MCMEWNQLFLEKENWQRSTFDRIKSDLISARDNRFIRYDNTEESHLVIIYGKSQVGKTTLILNMIGLKEEWFEEVYETLRAGVSRGNSSTSTAIIYSKSINDKYGCSLASINDLSSKSIQYFDKSGMIKYLAKIRQDVESNRIQSDCVLLIYIPNIYFIEDKTIDNISIMDMPGVESRNRKETLHVQNLITKYIPIASVCIIACRSNDIQSLETLVLPNRIEWKRMEHRFILVVTHAYNDGTTKKYFKVKSSERSTPFYNYVVDAYTQEIRKILGGTNRTEVYPVDVGDTLKRLCSVEIKDNQDVNEIVATKDRILHDLRSSIVNHKGQRLKSALMDLETVINHYGEDLIEDIIRDIEKYKEKIKEKEQLIEKTQKNIDSLSGDDSEQAEINDEIDYLLRITSQFSQLQSQCIFSLASSVNQYIINNALYKSKNDGDYLMDKDRSVLTFIRTHISEQISEYVRKICRLIEQADISIDLNQSGIIIDAENSYVLTKEDVLYPPKKGLFSRKEKVFISQIKSICDEVQSNINQQLNGYINKCIYKINDIIADKRRTLSFIKKSMNSESQKIKQYQLDIQGLRNFIDDLQEQKDDINNKRSQDQKTLAMYLKYAEQSYIEQRNDIILRINKSKRAEDKLLLILLLGLLDKDYQKVTGGIYEESY